MPPTTTTRASSSSAPVAGPGWAGLLVGSAAGAVAAHSRRPVLIVHDHST
jgi:nucleotide-binding universal stress UspA family protein